MRIKDPAKVDEGHIAHLSRLYPELSADVVREHYEKAKKKLGDRATVHQFVPLLAYREALVSLIQLRKK